MSDQHETITVTKPCQPWAKRRRQTSFREGAEPRRDLRPPCRIHRGSHPWQCSWRRCFLRRKSSLWRQLLPGNELRAALTAQMHGSSARKDGAEHSLTTSSAFLPREIGVVLSKTTKQPTRVDGASSILMKQPQKSSLCGHRNRVYVAQDFLRVTT